MLIEVTAPEGYEIVGYGELQPGEYYISTDGKAYMYHNMLSQDTPFYGIKVAKLARLSELNRGDKFKVATNGDTCTYTFITAGGHIVRCNESEPQRKYLFVSSTFILRSCAEDLVVYPVC